MEDVPFDSPVAVPAHVAVMAQIAKNGKHAPPIAQPERFEDATPVKVERLPLPAPAARAATPILGRELPHSDEVETGLLGCCFIDAGQTLQKCIERSITADCFYDPRNSAVFRVLTSLNARRVEVSVAIVAVELKTAPEFQDSNIILTLLAITEGTPTTAQANYFIDQVKAYAVRREIIRQALISTEDAFNDSLPIDDLAANSRRRLEHALIRTGNHAGQRMEWDELLDFDSRADPDCLMGNRFLGRTGAAVIVAPSGVGKSVLALQLGACAALQQHFFGMQMRLAMRVLYLQAEDDFGDVAESAQGFVRGMGIAESDRKRLADNLRIERWNDVSGDRFLARLRRQHAIWPYDLVVINPLFSFCGCNVSEQRELSPFLRNGLNTVLNETRAAAILVHHTNKPPADPSAQDQAMNAELRYLGSGSAELTNWARAYITLQGVRSAGDHVHKMVFVKRGGRTGIVDAEGKPTHSVLIEHSKTGLCWLPSDYQAEPKTRGKFLERFDLSAALAVYDYEKPWGENEILIARAMNMAPRTIRRHRQAIEQNA